MTGNNKLVVVAMTPRQAEKLSTLTKTGNKNSELITVFPASPLTRKVLLSFMKGNKIFRRLADGMIWGQVDPAKYSALSEKMDTALKSVNEVLQEGAGILVEMDRKKKPNKRNVPSTETVKEGGLE